MKLRIIFIRHAHKNTHGKVNRIGIQATKKFFNELHSSILPNTISAIYTSPIERTLITGKVYNSTFKNDVKIITSPALSEEPYTDERIEELKIGNGAWLEHNRPTTQLPSTRVLTTRLNIFINGLIQKHLKMVSKRDVVILCISHAPPLMLYIKKLFYKNINKLPGINYFDKMNGTLNYLEGFELEVERKEDDKIQIVFKYKGFKKKETCSISSLQKTTPQSQD